MGRRYRTLPVALAALPLLAACQQPPGTPLDLAPGQPQAPVADARSNADTLTGQRALAAGDLGTAKSAFSAALTKDPSDARAALGLAEAHLAANEVQAARQIYQTLATRVPSLSAEVNQGLGLIALRTGRTDQAVSLLGKSVQQNDGLWRAWLGLGQAHDRLDQPSAARRAFAAAERVAPVRAAVLNDLGMSYIGQKQPQRALEFFERALAMDPGYEIARGNVRIAKAMTRQYEDAISGAPQTQLPDVLNNVGYIAILNQDFQVADRYLRRAIDLSPVYHKAAVANLDLLARMASAQAPRKTAEADIANDAQIVLAPATPQPDRAAPTQIETADLPTQDKVARAANRQSREEDANLFDAPVVERLETAETRADPRFNWEDAPVKTASKPAPPKQVPAPDRTFKWEGPIAAEPEKPVGQAKAAPEPRSTDRTFNWDGPARDQDIETVDLPPVTRQPEQVSDKREFKWETPDNPVAIRTAPADAVAPKTDRQPIETTELRAPLLVDGLAGETGTDRQPTTVLPPAAEPPNTARRFTWAKPPE